MTTVQQPITRTELREELDRVLRFYATKEDLARTKEDLTREVGDLKATLRNDMLHLAIGLAGLQLIGLGAVAAIMSLLG